MSELAAYQTKHLFLLMGKNPLPNYVAAHLLLKTGGTLYLVHSEGPQGTGGVAQRLAAHFPQHHPHLIPVNPQDTADIRRQVELYLERTLPDPVGLNYTGGTKVMAVHTYQAVEEFCQPRGYEAIFSYLDADTLEMSIEPQPGQPAFRHKVVQSVELTIKEVFDLHGIKLQGRIQTEPLLPDLARALAQMHGTPTGIQAWKNSRNVLKACDGRSWPEVKAELLDADATPDVAGHLEQALGLAEPGSVDLRATARQTGLKSPRELSLWLDGTWLENWGLVCIKGLGYKHRARSLIGLTPSRFEIDIAVMRGYQLFALSCGVTRDRDKAKLKLLEIYTRARQIGGDEARVGLMCPVDDPRGLEQEIAREWDAGNRVRVFGRKHLPDLQNHFKNWFETV
jgi:hypothetical protein